MPPEVKHANSAQKTQCVVYWGWVCDVALIEYTLGSGETQEGREFRRKGTRGQWGQRELVYEQPGTEVDNSYHNWRVPSK